MEEGKRCKDMYYRKKHHKNLSHKEILKYDAIQLCYRI